MHWFKIKSAISPEAIQGYQAILKRQPHQPNALFNLAILYDQEGKTQKARMLLKTLTEVYPHHVNGWMLQARLSEKTNQPISAIEAYERVLSIQTDQLEAHYALGFLKQAQNQPEQAINHFQEVIRLDENHAEAHLNLGVLYAQQTRLTEAEKEYLQALALNPSLVEAYYNLGVFYEFYQKDTDKALLQYRKYIDRGGKDERIKNLLKKTGS